MTQANSDLKLWYKAPAQQWINALPIGNGRLGAMVFGGIQHERLQLNEDTLWSGGPRIWNNARASLVLPEVRRLIFEERYAEANTLAKQMQYYSASDLDRLERVDSLFPMNNLRHPSKGKRCLTGESVISVDGDGTIRRCHFIREKSAISTWITGKLRSYAPMKPVVVISTMCICPIWH